MGAPTVVDAGVLYVAEGLSPQAGAECQAECSRQLRALQQEGVVVLDAGGEIITEYRKQSLHKLGQPKVGALFLRWLIVNEHNSALVHRRNITPLGGDTRGYNEFPSDTTLTKFDISDRKYVAVALAHEAKPPILVSVDTDWTMAKAALQKWAVNVVELCPADMAVLATQKGINLPDSS